MKYLIPATILASSITLALGIFSGCGGGSNEQTSGVGIGGTGVTAAGQITGFGSVFVNGIRFETSNADISIDGAISSESDLRLGMVVTINGSLDGSGNSGTANTIVFNDEIQGPISTINTDPDGFSKSLDVMGITVIADGTSTVFDNVTFASLAVNDSIEVSGFINSDGDIQATRIEKKENFNPGSSEIELKGTVTSLVGTQFTLGNLTVNFAGADLSDIPGGVISNDMKVEVKGTLNGTIITAVKVQEEDDLFNDSEDKVSLEGVVSNYLNDGNFFVAGQLINASAAQKEPANLVIANGMNIEVEGPINNGILEAEKVEARGGDIKLEAKVSAVNTLSDTITLLFIPGTIEVLVDTQTTIQDENGSTTLDNINAGTDFIEVNGYLDGSGNIIASEISVQDSTDDDTVRGPVDSFESGSTITVLGLTFNTNASTDFQLANDTDTNSSDFYTALNNGDFVKIKDDENSRDGFAEEVEIEN